MLDNLNFTDVKPSVSALLGSVPLIYRLNQSRYSWKYIPQSSVGFVMANYLINSLRLEDEYDVIKKVAQTGLNAIAMNYVLDSRSNNALMKYGSILAMASAFPLSDYIFEKVIIDPDSNETLTVKEIPISIVSTGLSVASGWMLGNYELIPLINVAISSVPLAVSAFV